jgi:hypothetical protein
MSRRSPPRRPRMRRGTVGCPSEVQDHKKEEDARGKGGGGLSSPKSPPEFVSLCEMGISNSSRLVTGRDGKQRGSGEVVEAFL